MPSTRGDRQVPPGDHPGTGSQQHAREDGWWPWAFVLPFFSGLVVFSIWPTLKTGFDSLTKSGPFGGASWVGLANYATLFTDPAVYRAALNTVILAAILMVSVPLALVLAGLVNRKGLRGASVYRVIYFLPYVTMPTAIALVWRLIYNHDSGVLNWVLGLVGIDGPYWISTPWYSLVAVGILGVWSLLGFNMIIYLAAMRRVPPELYEAADLDGAGPWRQLFNVTFPMLRATTFFVSVVTLIAGLQTFDLLYALLGPTNPVMSKSQSLVYLFYQQGFEIHNQGYAAAIAVLIVVLIGCVTAVQFAFRSRRDDEIAY